VLPSAPLARAIRSVINKSTETKYVSQMIQNVSTPANEGYVREVLSGVDANTRLRGVIPNLSQGVGSNQRIGTMITPTKLRVTVKYYVDYSNERALECYVRQFLLTAKSIKNPALWQGQEQTFQSNMLDVGNGTNTYPDYGASQDTWSHTQWPITNETFSKLPKGNKTFKFSKQPGFIQNAAGNSGVTPYAPGRVVEHTSVFTIKCPKLKYEQFVEQGLNNYVQPTNFCPLWGACGFMITNENNAQYRQLLGAISGGGVGVPATPLIRYTIFSEMWFKDD